MANSMDMTNISMNRTDAILDREDVRAEYELGAGGSKSLYRTVERLERSSDSVVRYLGGQLASRYSVTLDRVLMGWTSIYFEAPGGPCGEVRIKTFRFGKSQQKLLSKSC